MSSAVSDLPQLRDMGTDRQLDGLSKLFAVIKSKNTIQELSPEYQKFAEWLRIEYVSYYWT